MQSIIVYRNPLEAMLWESGVISPIIVAMIVSVLVALVMAKIVERYTFRPKSFMFKYQSQIVAIPTILSALLVLVVML